MYVAPHADLEDGKLDVMLASATSRLTFLRDLPSLFKGTHVENDYVQFLKGEVVEVSADRQFTIYADGDPIGELPCTVRAVPDAVKVLLPA